MPKALITGGAGFIGSHLAEALLARGDEVHVIDNLSTGSIENIEHLKDEPRFHYVIDSILNADEYQATRRFCGTLTSTMLTGWVARRK